MKKKTFTMGGIHPPEYKRTADLPITTAPLADTVTVPLIQHIGKPAVPTVKKGDEVKVGTRIAEADGPISANVHAPVSGTIKKIEDHPDISGYRRPAIIIAREGDTWEEGIDTTAEIVRPCDLSPEEIVEHVQSAGVVGLGGAMFPAHVKMKVPEGKAVETLLVNGGECEPFLTTDHRLTVEAGREILIGVEITRKALGVKRAVVGIEANKPDAIETLAEEAEDFEGIEIQPLKVRYPQGGERQLIKAILNREVPPGDLPLAVGAVVFNVGTVFAIYEAVQKNKPLVERVLTLSGPTLENPANFRARIGTPVSTLVETIGGLPEDTGKVIGGGPLMGKTLADLDVPVIKGTSGILIFPEKDSHRRPEQACIRCGRCAEVCCQGLEPFMISALVKAEKWERLDEVHVSDCLECASCSFTCPANLPLLDRIRIAKAVQAERKKKGES